MPLEGIEPTTAVFEGAKTVHALDGAAAVIGSWKIFLYIKREHEAAENFIIKNLLFILITKS